MLQKKERGSWGKREKPTLGPDLSTRSAKIRVCGGDAIEWGGGEKKEARRRTEKRKEKDCAVPHKNGGNRAANSDFAVRQERLLAHTL